MIQSWFKPELLHHPIAKNQLIAHPHILFILCTCLFEFRNILLLGGAGDQFSNSPFGTHLATRLQYRPAAIGALPELSED